MQRSVETVALFILIVVATLRPLVAEMYDSAGNPFTEALGSVSDPSPLRTLVFDLMILVSTFGWLLARAVGPARRYRWTGLEWGGILMVLAAIVSCGTAGNQRLAINATIDWLCYPLLAIVLVQLLHRPWHRRLLLAAVIASACAQAVQCFDQYFVGFEDTWNHYQSMKEEFWARQGVELDSSKVELFERRMQAREASGFFPHSNIAGSYLVLCGIVALGITFARWKRAGDAGGYLLTGFCAVATAAILGSALLTGSLGAVVAGIAGLLVWVVVHLLRGWISAHRLRAVLIGWVCVVGGGLAVVGYGLTQNRLPHMSLMFRWQYWSASADLISDHWLTGVGRENFSRHYLQYKPIDAPEEVAGPHNLFVQAAADWGILGLAGVLAAVVGVSLAISRPTPGQGLEESRRPAASIRAGPFVWGGALIVTLTLARLPMLDGAEADFFYYAYYASVSTGVAWLIGFAGFVSGGRGSGNSRGDEPGVVTTAVSIGLLAFALHEMINFALFVPGAATTCFTLLAVGIAARSPVTPSAKTRSAFRRLIPPALGAVVVIAFLALALRPVAEMTRNMERGRQAGQQVAPVPIAKQLADRYFLEAMAADPLDPTPCVARAEWLFAVSSMPEFRDEALSLTIESLEAAIERDPFNVRHRRLLMRVYRAKAGHTGDVGDYHAAIQAAKEALRLYALDPAGMVALGDCQLEAGEATDADGLLRDALETYERALALDESRPEWERIRGFRPREREEIRGRIQRVRVLLTRQRGNEARGNEARGNEAKRRNDQNRNSHGAPRIRTATVMERPRSEPRQAGWPVLCEGKGWGHDDRTEERLPRKGASPNDRPASVPIHGQERAVVEFIESVAAPFPLGRIIDQPAGERVLMAIVQLLAQLALGEDIAVIAARVHHLLFVERPACPMVQRVRPETLLPAPHVAETLLAVPPDILLEGLQGVGNGDGNIVGARMRVKQDVDMFRHYDVTDQAYAERGLERAQGFDNYAFHTVVVEELEPSVA